MKIGRIVEEFYDKNPFPGFDLNKYTLKEDLYRNANTYSRLLDDQIPWDVSVLDAGCGTGQLSALLGVKGRKILAIDFSEGSLAKGRELADRLRLKTVTFRKADLLDLNLEGQKFDYIFCNGVLHHTGNPYRGFRNIVKSAREGTYIVVGLYNRYGRLRLKLKRIWINWKFKKDKEKSREAIQEMLVKDEQDVRKQDTWFADQYHHPHESSHTITELLTWYRKNDVEYINSIPPIELFRREKNARRIFKKAEVKGWQNSRVSHFLKQLKWIIALRKTGGYFMIVGRKS